MGLVSENDETSYRHEITKFVNWCQNNNLVLNVKKTKEMIFDFRKKRNDIVPLNILEENVDIVAEYKYLGVHIDNDMSWETHVRKTFSKANQRLYFLRKMNKFSVSKDIMRLFYCSVIQSVITYCCVVWFNSLRVQDRLKLEKVARTAKKIIGKDVECLRNLADERILTHLKKVLEDSSHPLNPLVILNESGRARQIRVRTGRFRKTFIPCAINLFNSIQRR